MRRWTVISVAFIHAISVSDITLQRECMRVFTAYIVGIFFRYCITFLIPFRFFSFCVGPTFAGIAFSEGFVRKHSVQVPVLPCLKRFFCDLEKTVSSSALPHIAQTAEDASAFAVPSVAGELLDCININVVVSERELSRATTTITTKRLHAVKHTTRAA